MSFIPAPIQRLYEVTVGLAFAGERRRVCSGCRGVRFERVPRVGMIRAQIMPFFNLYPWRCVLCNRVIYRTLRSNEEDPGNRF